jgi:hypothetical protein
MTMCRKKAVSSTKEDEDEGHGSDEDPVRPFRFLPIDEMQVIDIAL